MKIVVSKFSTSLPGLLILTFVLILADACSKKTDSPKPEITTGNIDSLLFVQSNLASQGFRAYKNIDSVRRSSSATGHTPWFKVRLNAVALSVLGADGKLPVGKSFPDGSLIVKELYIEKTGTVQYLAIMKKEPANPFSEKGWLWSELHADGRGFVSAKEKGLQCVGCHTPNSRDYVRVFDLF